MERRITRTVKAGNVEIGSGSKITVQSMLNVLAHDIEGNVAQAVELEKAGCEIVRLTVPDIEAVKTLYAVKMRLKYPLLRIFILTINVRLRAWRQALTRLE